MRRFLLALATLPLLLPPFLLSIGWSYSAWPHRAGPALVCSCSPSALGPLALLASYAAARGLPRSLIDAARLAGGERAVLRAALRYAAPPTALASALRGRADALRSRPRTGLRRAHRGLRNPHQLRRAVRSSPSPRGSACCCRRSCWSAARRSCGWRRHVSVRPCWRARSATAPRRPGGRLGVDHLPQPLAAIVLFGRGRAGGRTDPAAVRRALGPPLVDQPHAELVALWVVGEAMRTVGRHARLRARRGGRQRGAWRWCGPCR